jgi:hypothetical protein
VPLANGFANERHRDAQRSTIVPSRGGFDLDDCLGTGARRQPDSASRWQWRQPRRLQGRERGLRRVGQQGHRLADHNAVLEDLQAWSARPLLPPYAAVFIDAI